MLAFKDTGTRRMSQDQARVQISFTLTRSLSWFIYTDKIEVKLDLITWMQEINCHTYVTLVSNERLL